MSRNTQDPIIRISVTKPGNGEKSPGTSASGLLDFGFVHKKSARSISQTSKRTKEPVLKIPIENAKSTAQKPKQRPKQSVWEKCLFLLVNDFLDNRRELLRLNPGRRKEIEVYLHQLGGIESRTPLEVFLSSASSTREGSAFLRFAWEVSVLLFFQFLLLKRWTDQGRIPKESFLSSSKRVNWLISQYSKTNSSGRFLGRQSWGFLRINRYSWFNCSARSWDRMNSLCADLSLKDASGSLLNSILLEIKSNEEFSHVRGLEYPTHSMAVYELLSCLKRSDEDPSLLRSLQYGLRSDSTMVCGLLHGQAMTSVASVDGINALDNTVAVSVSEFEQYISEVQVLWQSTRDRIPAVQVNSLPTIKSELPKESMNSVVFFGTQFDQLEDEAILFSLLADKLRENGKLVYASDSYWITESSEAAEKLRTSVLETMAIRAVIDLRFVKALNKRLALPNCIYLLEKNSSKEYRDSNRPIVIKAVGQSGNAETLQDAWVHILESIQDNKAAGEVTIETLGEGFEKIKVEAMSAATLQGQLPAAPWTSLAEPAFYQISSKLKRQPFKAGQLGVILKPQNSTNMSKSFERAVQFLEVPGRALYATASGTPVQDDHTVFQSYDQVSQHVFLPDISVTENPAFLSAVVNSSPVQFWYRLEWEQLFGVDAKRSRNRGTAQMLKLLPVAKLFELGALTDASVSKGQIIEEFESYRSRAVQLCKMSSWSTEEALELQQMIIDLETTTQHHVEIARGYMNYLYPNEEIQRWHIPEILPEIDAERALMVLSHLPQAPIRQHPSIQITPVKNVADFKVTNSKFSRGKGGYSEILLYSGPEVMMRIHGPSLLVRAAESGLQKRFGRPWSEVSNRILFPIDISLMAKQLKDFVHLTQTALSGALRSIQISDFIFARLFALDCEVPNQGDAQIIRNHLMPSNATVALSQDYSADFSFEEAKNDTTELGLV